MCGSFYNFWELTDNAYGLATFADCINSCSTMQGCVAVAWADAGSYPETDESACGYASSYDATDVIPLFDMAFLPGNDGSETEKQEQ